MTTSFFEAQTDESRVKAEIVEAFFVGWARIIGGFQKRQRGPVSLGYADLFAGRGRYRDGAEGTALRVVRQILQNDTWRSSTQIFLNEPNANLRNELERAVTSLPRYDELRYPPIIRSDVVDAEYRECLSAFRNRPTLYFVDPFGYKEIALSFLKDLVSAWGNDLIFFFNFRRVNAAVPNQLFAPRIDALFGSRAEALRREVAPLHGYRRERAIVEAISAELSDRVADHVQKFRFAPQGREATHYLFYVGKHPRGHEVITDVMAGKSSHTIGGVATFEFSGNRTQLLFAVDQIDKIADELANLYGGRSMSVDAVYSDYVRNHQVQRKNVKEALRRLERRTVVDIDPPAELRPKDTLADHCIVYFTGGGIELDE